MELKKLTTENALEVYRNNEKFKNMIFLDALDEAYYQADEILSYFRHYDHNRGRAYEVFSHYEIDLNAAYIKVDTRYYEDFFQDCIKVAEVFGIFDTMHNIDHKFTRALDRLEIYNDAAAGYYDMSEKNFLQLEKWLENIVTEAAEYIAQYAQEAYNQFLDENILEDYFLTVWMYNREDVYSVDAAGHVYETAPRCIA